MYVLAALLLLGLLCNALVRPVDHRHFLPVEVVASPSTSPPTMEPAEAVGRGSAAVLLLAWSAVGLTLAWGVWVTLAKAAVLFQ